MNQPNQMSTPNPMTLGPEGRLYMLSWLHADLASGVPVTVETWRQIYGHAADYQTTFNAKRALAIAGELQAGAS